MSANAIIVKKSKSLAKTIQVIRKYKIDSMAVIKDEIENHKPVLTAGYMDADEIRILLSLAKELKALNDDYAFIDESGEEQDIQYLKNQYKSGRDTERWTANHPD